MMIRASTIAFVLLSAAGAAAQPRVAAVAPPEPSAQPAAGIDARAPSSTPAQRGLALGVELGEPSSATIGWFDGKLALLGALGTGTFEGPGFHAHADAQLVVARLRPDAPLRIGLGARYYHHGYQPASIDELPDDHLGIRASVALALERGAMQLYAEAVPGIDVARSRSCSLASGARSVCPHAQESPFFLQLVVGARWFISN